MESVLKGVIQEAHISAILSGYSVITAMIAVLPCPLGAMRRLTNCRVAAAVVMAAFAFAVCYFRGFILPHIPIVLWGDQVGFFNNGSRMVLGQLPYRDYFEFVTPGSDLIYAIMIRCFGLQMWIPNLLIAALAALIALLMTFIASRIVHGMMVILPAVLFTGFTLPVSMEATHHWFSTAAAMAALLLLLNGITWRRLALAGVMCGIAASFTQSKGAIIIIVVTGYLFWRRQHWNSGGEHWRGALIFPVAAVATVVAFNAPFMRAAGVHQWVFCTLTYPLRYYPVPATNNWRVILHEFGGHTGIMKWIAAPFTYLTVPFAYLASIAVVWRSSDEDRKRHQEAVFLIMVVGIAMFLAVAPSPSIKRLATASPPATILFSWLLTRNQKSLRPLIMAIAAAAVVLAIAVPIYIQTRWHAYLDLPAGRSTFIQPDLFEEYRWLLANTHPGDYYFGVPPFYYAFHLLNPAAIEAIHDSDYTRPEQVASLVEALERRRVPLMVLRDFNARFDTDASPSDHLMLLRAYVVQNYRITRTFSTGDDVWQRIDSASQSILVQP